MSSGGPRSVISTSIFCPSLASRGIIKETGTTCGVWSLGIPCARCAHTCAHAQQQQQQQRAHTTTHHHPPPPHSTGPTPPLLLWERGTEAPANQATPENELGKLPARWHGLRVHAPPPALLPAVARPGQPLDWDPGRLSCPCALSCVPTIPLPPPHPLPSFAPAGSSSCWLLS
jgi:hypothetical protein